MKVNPGTGHYGTGDCDTINQASYTMGHTAVFRAAGLLLMNNWAIGTWMCSWHRPLIGPADNSYVTLCIIYIKVPG